LALRDGLPGRVEMSRTLVCAETWLPRIASSADPTQPFSGVLAETSVRRGFCLSVHDPVAMDADAQTDSDDGGLSASVGAWADSSR
jgi:hypothetical protein